MKKIIIVSIIFSICAKTLIGSEIHTRYPLLPAHLNVNKVIVLIGDGMGLAQVVATRIKKYGAMGRLTMELMPVTGLCNTYSADALITDSGASATAFATGKKTNNGYISISPQKEKLPTLLEICKANGFATGLVATSAITHATPAAFASHAVTRNDESSIAEQLLANRVNVLLGGGQSYFLPRSDRRSERPDNRDLIREAEELGYRFVQNKEELNAVYDTLVLGLFQSGHLRCTPDEPSIADMTLKAIELLNTNSKGFFLMSEGSQIDWKCHDNNISEMIEHVLQFDKAIKVALDFALQDSHTIVVVLADHETGGLGITGGTLDGKELKVRWLSREHTAIMTPIFAFGPKAERFTGVYENSDIPKIIAEIIGVDIFDYK